MYRFATTLMILALGLGYQANAAPSQDLPSVIVQLADLDLTHSDGVAVLYRRLKVAAQTVCASLDGRGFWRKTRYEMCWHSALSTAVAKVDQPALTAYYRAKIGGGNATITIAQK